MKLSFVIPARNDNYGGDFLPRLQTSLDNFFQSSAIFSLDAEVVLVEWNNPIGALEFQDALNWDHVTIPVRIIHVPGKIHDSLPGSKNGPLFFGYGCNVGIRRAAGQFVLTSTADIIHSADMISFLSKTILDNDCFYAAVRHDIDDYGEVVQVRDGEPYLGLHMDACGDFTLMARERWMEIRGYPEVPFNTYTDGTVLWLAHQIGMKQIVLDAPIYHINHGGVERDSRLSLDLLTFPLPRNVHDDWGFRDVKFRETLIGERNV